MRNLLLEDKRSSLLSKSKSGGNYRDQSKGKNRYQRRLKSKLASSVKNFNSINMDKLFRTDILDVTIDVIGESGRDPYKVRISFSGIIDELHNFIKSHDDKLDRRIVLKALTRAFNSDDVYFNCSCDDFKYRFKYWATKSNMLIGEPQDRSIDKNVWHFGARKDDPNGLDVGNYYNDKGPACKHVLLALSDASWLIKIASVIYNYIKYMEDNNERLYQRYIYPAIYQEPYENRQLSIFDDEEEPLDSDEETIKASNKSAKERGQFKKGNEYRFKKNPDKNQVTFDDLENEETEESEEDSQ